MNAVKDIYIYCIDYLDFHPHYAFWAIVVLAALVIVT
jgi:hypothetical protein